MAGVANSAVEQTVRVTDGTEYSGYEIEDIGLVQASYRNYDEVNEDWVVDKDNNIEFIVNGLLNGGKIALGSSEYTAEVVGIGAVNNPLHIYADQLDYDYDVHDLVDTEFTLRVTINASGQVLEKKFTVSPDFPATEEFFFTKAEVGSAYAQAKPVTEAMLESGKTVLGLTSNEEEPVQLKIATVDQYGNKEVQKITAHKVTIVPEVVGQVAIVGNGTANAKVTLAGDATEANVTMTIKLGKATVTIPVLVVPATPEP